VHQGRRHQVWVSALTPNMKWTPASDAGRAIVIACGLSLVWLTLAVLPIALYQYFAISPSESFAGVVGAAWSAYLAPLALLGWTPAFSSVDPLVTLIPSFALLFAFWSVILFAAVFGVTRLRRAA
jgi:hypothetical protein